MILTTDSPRDRRARPAGAGIPIERFFRQIPPTYDILNGVLTGGIDRSWRRSAARECMRDSPRRVLDLCCGTGDLLLEMARQARGGVEFVGADASEPMLDVAKRKVASSGIRGEVSFVACDATALPFDAGSFDAVGLAFAFRSIWYGNPRWETVVREIVRVLVPRGRFVMVETSQPSSRLLRSAYHGYMRLVVPLVGQLVSGHGRAYRLLSASAVALPGPEDVSRMLAAAGFAWVEWRPLAAGVAAVHVAHT
jgi:demethylmenaquinone methyltransferase/2-methoxy-6-polyprenyl-1,4-benzoquinol methylase